MDYAVIAKNESGTFETQKDDLSIVEARKMLVTFPLEADPKIVPSGRLNEALQLNNG